MISITYWIGDRLIQYRLSLSIFIPSFMSEPCGLVRKCEYFWHSYLERTYVYLLMVKRKGQEKGRKSEPV